jgi:hypothetical protein
MECVDNYGDGTCRGDVDSCDLSGDGRALPRCEKHIYEEIWQVEQEIQERYPA